MISATEKPFVERLSSYPSLVPLKLGGQTRLVFQEEGFPEFLLVGMVKEWLNLEYLVLPRSFVFFENICAGHLVLLTFLDHWSGKLLPLSAIKLY